MTFDAFEGCEPALLQAGVSLAAVPALLRMRAPVAGSVTLLTCPLGISADAICVALAGACVSSDLSDTDLVVAVPSGGRWTVSDVRALLADRPVPFDVRHVVVSASETMPAAGWDALLKTLERDQARSVWWLSWTGPGRPPATVAGRVTGSVDVAGMSGSEVRSVLADAPGPADRWDRLADGPLAMLLVRAHSSGVLPQLLDALHLDLWSGSVGEAGRALATLVETTSGAVAGSSPRVAQAAVLSAVVDGQAFLATARGDVQLAQALVGSRERLRLWLAFNLPLRAVCVGLVAAARLGAASRTS